MKEARFYTIQLLQMVDDGVVGKDHLIASLLGYLSEAEVKDFMRMNDYMADYMAIVEEA
jgi:hypothetical protein